MFPVYVPAYPIHALSVTERADGRMLRPANILYANGLLGQIGDRQQVVIFCRDQGIEQKCPSGHDGHGVLTCWQHEKQYKTADEYFQGRRTRESVLVKPLT